MIPSRGTSLTPSQEYHKIEEENEDHKFNSPLSATPLLPDPDQGKEPHVCDHCGYVVSPRAAWWRSKLSFTGLWKVWGWALLGIVILLMVVWTGGMSLAFGKHAYYDLKFQRKKYLADEFPLIPTTFQPDHRFMDADPFDTPFWAPTVMEDSSVDYLYNNKSSRFVDNAWNYYGLTNTYVPKSSPYWHNAGIPLEPLWEEIDGDLVGETGFGTSYKHEIHCLGVVKHVLHNFITKGNMVEPPGRYQITPEHIEHCLELIRHGLMCNPDLQFARTVYDEWGQEEEVGVFWGGEERLCRDQEAVHRWLGDRNLGYRFVLEDVEGVGKVTRRKVFRWPLGEQDTVKKKDGKQVF